MKLLIAVSEIQIFDLQIVRGENLVKIKLLNGVLLNDNFLGNNPFAFDIL